MCVFFLYFLVFPFFAHAIGEVHIPFSQIGSLHQTDRLVQVSATLDLHTLWQQCEVLLRNLEDARAKTAIAKAWLHAPISDLRAQCRFSRSLAHTFIDQYSPSSHRPRRQLGLLAVAATSVFSALGFESLFHADDRHILETHQHEITQLSDQVSKLITISNSLATDLLAISDDVQQLRFTQSVGEKVQFVSHRLSSTSAGIVALLHGTLSHQLFHPNSVRKMWTNLTQIANKHHLHLAFDNFLNLYEVPVSFSLSEGRVQVIIPIPLVSHSFQLYQFLPFPVLLQEKDKFLPFLPSPREDFIAVDHASTVYLPLSTSDISRCIVLGTRHYCSHLITMKSPSCIASLFFGSLKTLSRVCPLFHYPDTIAIQLISSSKLLISSHLQSIPFTVDCQNGSFSTHNLLPGHQIIPLARSCALSSQFFSVPAFSLSYVHTTIRSAKLDMNTSFLPATSSHLPQLIHDTDVLGQHSQNLLSYIRLHPSHPSKFDFSLLFIIGLVSSLFLLYLLYLYCQARRQAARN